jgi:putative oxidoreductase
MKSTSRLSRFKDWLFDPPVTGHAATAIMRFMAGGVFLSEGILKFVFANQGVGRFTKLGFPMPDLTASFIGGLEIVGGCLLIAGLLTRAIAIPFVFEMLVAILATKVSLYLGTSPLPLPPAPPRTGMWAVLHESRSDWAQLLTSLYLIIVGPGSWSLDALLHRRRQSAVGVVAGGPRLGAGSAGVTVQP